MAMTHDADARLWDRWARRHEQRGLDPGGITRDGIVDPERFGVAGPRLLFIAKESDRYAGGDMRELLLVDDKNARRFSDGIGRWAHGIFNGFPEPESDSQRDRSRISDSLTRIATVNLKKQTGGPTADEEELMAHALADMDLLVEQIRAIAPDLIVTCATVEVLKRVTELTRTAHRHFYRAPELGCPVVAFRHPGRASRVGAYNHLRDRIAEIRRAVPDCGI